VRSRNIKPGFFQNEVLPELSAHTRLLFIGLWCLCDWEGRMELRPKRILMSIFPYEQHLDINQMLLELHNTGFITMYGDGKYLQVNNFLKHQHPIQKERDKPSSIPDQSQFDPGSILDRSKIDPSMIPVGLIPDILKPDVLIPDVLITDTERIEPVGSVSASKSKKKDLSDYKGFMDEWNKIAGECGLTPCRSIPSGRQKTINARLKETDWVENYQEALQKLHGIKWIRGNEKYRPRGIDWFIKPDTVAQILEGTCDDSKRDFSCASPDDSAGKFW